MNKHEQARKVLNAFRNSHYNDIGCEEQKVVAQALDVILPYLVATEKQLEQCNISDTSKEESSMMYYNLYKELKRDVKRYFQLSYTWRNLSKDEEKECDLLFNKLSKVGENHE